MALKSIEEQWQGFSQMVFRNMTPTDTQVREMRKAFFAGAWSLMCAFEEIGEDHVTEDEGVRYMEARKEECVGFKRQLIAEYSERN